MLWYDWQAAAIADDEGLIHDQSVWSGFYDQRALIDRLQLIAKGELTPEARLLCERYPDATIRIHGESDLPEFDWPLPSNEALAAADAAAIEMSRAGVADAAGDPDKRLEHLVRASDELRATYLTMESRLVEWVGLFLPELRFGKDRSSLGKTVGESEIGRAHV